MQGFEHIAAACSDMGCPDHGVAASNARQSAFYAAADAAGTNDRADVTTGSGVSRYDGAGETKHVTLSRSYLIRNREHWDADVPVEMLEDSTYFLGTLPTDAFDRWMRENGDLTPDDQDEVFMEDDGLILDWEVHDD